MERPPHENVATVLVDPLVLGELELDLATRDLWVWSIASAGIAPDGPRLAFQIRRRMLMAKRGAWDCAMHWTPVWIAFGETWHRGDDPLPGRQDHSHGESHGHLPAQRSQIGAVPVVGGAPRIQVRTMPATSR